MLVERENDFFDFAEYEMKLWINVKSIRVVPTATG